MARRRESPEHSDNPLFAGAGGDPDRAASGGESAPLAARMRPRKLDDFIGQEHIVGPGRLLRRAIQADLLSSVIFSGPPGTGKTTLAMVIANTTRSRFVSLNAVLSGVKDVREAIENARQAAELYGQRTILFVDEVHRWNKAQQDALLPWVENGTVILIGATTENPFFEVNSALVSRSRIFQLKTLTPDDLRRIAEAALADRERGYGAFNVRIDADALDHLIAVADGDARSLLNALQLSVETSPETFPPPSAEEIHIDREIAEESIQRRAILYDKEGDYHFDTISAFIKSLRGSDPDAALYWMARMIEGGEDPRYLFRRMLILAGEDVGLADPHALGVVESAAAAFDRVGLPEGQFHLTHAALYLATTAKSNSALGYFDAASAVRDEQRGQVPRHLQDANRDAKGFGHGEGYLYPHAYRDHWVAQQYLPASLQGRVFYHPSDQGYEARVREEVERRREVQLQAMSEALEGGAAGGAAGWGAPDEILTYGPTDKRLDAWLRRSSETALAEVRDSALAALAPARHNTVAVGGTGIGFLLWEARRRVPEGQVYAVFRNQDELDTAAHYAEGMDHLHRPTLCLHEEALAPQAAETPRQFDRYLGRNLLYAAEAPAQILAEVASLLNPGGRAVFVEPLPRESTRLSTLLEQRGVDATCIDLLRRAETALETGNDPRMRFTAELAESACREAGFDGASSERHPTTTQIELREATLRRWMETLSDAFATPPEWDRCTQTVLETLSNRSVPWERTYLILAC